MGVQPPRGRITPHSPASTWGLEDTWLSCREQPTSGLHCLVASVPPAMPGHVEVGGRTPAFDCQETCPGRCRLSQSKDMEMREQGWRAAGHMLDTPVSSISRGRLLLWAWIFPEPHKWQGGGATSTEEKCQCLPQRPDRSPHPLEAELTWHSLNSLTVHSSELLCSSRWTRTCP